MELTRFLMLAAGVRAAIIPLSLPAVTPLTPLPTPLVNGASTNSSWSNTTVVRGGFQPSEIAAKAETTNQPAEPSTSDTKLYIGTSGTHWFIVSGSNPLATQTANNATGTNSPKATAAPHVTGAPEVMERVFEIGGVTISDNSESKLVVGSQTLEPGSSIVVGTGASTTPIAIHTEKGTTRIVVGTTTAIVPTPTPIQTKKPAPQTIVTIPAGTIAYNSKSQIIVNGHTLTPSSTLTLGTGTKATAYHLAIKPTATYLAVASEGSEGASTTMIDLWGSKAVPTRLDQNGSGSSGTAKPTTSSAESTATRSAAKETLTLGASTLSTIPTATAAASTATANKGSAAAVLTADDSVPTTTTTPAASSVAAATYTGAAVPSAMIDYLKIGAIGLPLVIFI
ncbi:Phytanoyl- dioxygenase [Lasiodiplodia theobromae]|uniref:Phytanoyl- dioxygenase n=1 Tax=Lasiodiplodia theobromae TaxID=45133 RepID=UPI0015C35E63|nr:Phytanoyl- dioxygenase [Lasiodiplodia theobromae]KAF4545836.1 Phytanoyl- dioxygenase [Lasiodiplodia theobromae]